MENEDQAERSRTNWTLPMERYLIEILVDQINKGSKSEKGFTKDAWKEMTVLLNKKFTVQLSKEHVKNRHKSFRKQWMLMKAIIDQSGFGWDPVRQMVCAEDGVWDAYIAAHPKAKKYRRQILPDYNAMCTIFGDRNMDGKVSHSCNEFNTDCKESTALVAVMEPSAVFFQSPVVSATQGMLLDVAHGSSSHSGEDAGEARRGNKRRAETPSPLELPMKNRITQEVPLDAHESSHSGEDMRETNRENKCRSETPPTLRLPKQGMISQGVLLDNVHVSHHSGEDVGETSRQNKQQSETPSSLQHFMSGQATVGDALVDAIREMAGAVRDLADRQKYVDASASNLQEKCISVLDQMPDLDYGIYLQAAELFEDEKKAKTFLVLSEGARRDWLLMKLGPGRP